MEFDGYVFGRVSMLAGDLAVNHHFQKVRLCNAHINRNWPVFPSSFLKFERWWTGLDLAFTSIESLNFPETSPQLSELSLRLANAPAFSNPLNLLKLGQKLTHWLIGLIDSLADWLMLLLVDVCWCLLPVFWVFSVSKICASVKCDFFQRHMATRIVPPIVETSWKAKEVKMVRLWITRSAFSQFGSNSNNATAW